MTLFYRWLWTLFFANPMVVQVVQAASRRSRHLWVRMGYLGGLILLVLTGLFLGRGMASNVSLTELAKAGTQVFQWISYGQVIFICLLAPLFMAAAIQSQRSGETMDILLTTPLSNLQIVLGTLGSRLVFILALLVSGLPLFSVLMIFGGVPVSSVFVAFAVAGLTALVVGSVAVTLSVTRTGGRKIIFVFVISIAAYLLFTYLFDTLLLRNISGNPNATTWLTPLHPLLVLEASQSTATYQPPGADVLASYPAVLRWYLGEPFSAFCTICLATSVLLVGWCAWQVRKVGTDVKWRRLRRWLRLGVAGERRRKPRTVWSNPVAWREASTRGSRFYAIIARWGFVAIGLVVALVLLGLYHFQALSGVRSATGLPMGQADVFHSALLVLLLLELTVIVLVALYMSAGAVSREREDGTLDLMLTTPISQKMYLWGKLRGLVSFLSMLIAVPVGTLAVVSVYTMVAMVFNWPTAVWQKFEGGVTVDVPILIFEAPVLLALMLVPFVALCVMVGMSWSLKSKGVLGAVVPSVAIIATLATILGFCGMAMVENIKLLGPVVNALSPVTNIVMVVNPWDHVSDFVEDPLSGRVGMAMGAVVCAGSYSLIVYLMLLGMVKSFDHTVRRLSGG
ncbi:MAG: ABC transporter permease subunit [Phycisphaera sp.]|nr:ABC transporter permease subunit [Phycisphaera sp.]